MKNILVLTDFTENAAHAALSGVMLSKHMHANILLFNSSTVQAVAPVYAGGPTVIDEISLVQDENKETLQKLADSLKPLLAQPVTDWQPAIHYEEGLGALGYGVKNLINEKNIEMVVMGAREGSAFDHFFSGSETFSVIDHSSRPVLIVPENAELDHIRKVLFATDFAEADIKAIQYLVKLGELFNYRLELVHINLLGEDDITHKVRKTEFMSQFHRHRFANPEVKEIHGKDIAGRLNSLCEEWGADVLSFTHYKNSWFSKLFGRSATKKALTKQKLPVLVFPPKFGE